MSNQCAVTYTYAVFEAEKNGFAVYALITITVQWTYHGFHCVTPALGYRRREKNVSSGENSEISDVLTR